MLTNRQLFLQNLAQTSDAPLQIEIEKAEGIYLYGPDNKTYIDLISGVSVSNVGHRHPAVVEAIKQQVDKYMHLMVYGEYIQTPQVRYASMLSDVLPGNLKSVYLVNSGSEAIEGALKLAKRFTGRSEIIAYKNAYHGSTHGSLSVMGNETLKNSFRPLLPGIKFIEFNNEADIEQITTKTACVLIEPIQGEAGIRIPNKSYLNTLREKCNKTGTLLIFDEIQTGFGRTGELFASIKYNVVPDIMTIAKGMGGGMPIGAFISSKEIMDSLKTDPVLGHITTFGGHPVSCAAAIATLEVIQRENLLKSVNHKGELFKEKLKNKHIKEIRGVGLFMAVELENFKRVKKVIDIAVQKGLITDWFLFCDNAFRISPPLTITDNQIIESCKIISEAIDESYND
ncbi:MAG: aspartate aminotransferase family protein [Bacteroidales bacterium]